MCGCSLLTPALGTWPATQACALTGNQMGNPLVRRPELNPRSHPSQGSVDEFKADDIHQKTRLVN